MPSIIRLFNLVRSFVIPETNPSLWDIPPVFLFFIYLIVTHCEKLRQLVQKIVKSDYLYLHIPNYFLSHESIIRMNKDLFVAFLGV